MNVFLWVLQVLLALVFIFHARMMLMNAAPPGPQMAYITELPAGLRRFAAIAEGLAGLGLILPALTNILPGLTPLAAVGLVIIMLGAIVIHLRRGEIPNTVFNAVLLVLAAVIAYGRLVWAPF